jgi:nucleoside 2-deoxyribosyltransferase
MIIYLSGPYRGKVEENIKAARKVAIELWEDGYTVICPHLNTANFEKDCLIKDESYLSGDFEILSRCDAMIVLPNFEHSEGTLEEIRYASGRGIPVTYYPEKPEFYSTETNCPNQCRSFIDTVMSMYRVHLKKNADYSPANIIGTGELGVVVRLWDKIARLMNLSGFKLKVESCTFDKPKQPKNESVDDAYMDLSVYGIIGQLVRKGVWGK